MSKPPEDIFAPQDAAQTAITPEDRAELRLNWITTRQELNEAEQANIASATVWAHQTIARHDVMEAHYLLELHRRMFGEVWGWAGRYRTHNVNLEVSSDWPQIEVNCHALLGDVRHWVENKTFEPDEIAMRFHHRLVSIHLLPKRKWQACSAGRHLMALKLDGKPFTWGAGGNLVGKSKVRDRYIPALKTADKSDYVELVTFARSSSSGSPPTPPSAPPKPDRYNPRVAEPRWQKKWDDAGIFATSNADLAPAAGKPARETYYVLEMFPYPSGRIHMGHVRNYTMGDVVARYKRARGFTVLHPMGWDAFGMPAENAAMERKVHPGAWTRQNIAAMKSQLQSMGLSLDWAREIATCDPSYYKHQQKMFLDFLKAGLVERKQSKVNWDPVDMTVLANEQVIDGKGWRSGALVEQRELDAVVLQDQRLCARSCSTALDTLERWPEKVRADAEELDRPLGGPAGPLRARSEDHAGRRERAGDLHHPRRHAVRRALRRGRAGSSDRAGGGEEEPGARRLHRRVQAHRHRAGGDRDRREAGLRHRHPRRSIRSIRLGTARLRGELHPDGLRHRRDLRLPGARPARPRLRQQVRPRQHAGGLPAGAGPEVVRHHRHRL